jgi:hypothetical protein
VKRIPRFSKGISAKSFENQEEDVELMSEYPDLNLVQIKLLCSIHSHASFVNSRDPAGMGLRSVESTLADLINPFFFDLKKKDQNALELSAKSNGFKSFSHALNKKPSLARKLIMDKFPLNCSSNRVCS